MLKRRELFRNAAAFAVGSTFSEQLPTTGLLSGILLQVDGSLASNSEKATAQWRLDDWLSTLQVLGNGSQVIHSARWGAFRYRNLLDQYKLPPAWWRNYATQSTRSTVLVNFGRYLYDPDYGLDLSRWDRVELKLTNTTSATYYASGLTVTAWLVFLHNLPSAFQRGYMRFEEFKSWTTVQNAWEYTQLPTTSPLRGVHLQLVPYNAGPGVDATSLINLADNVEFSISNPKLFLHNGGVFQLMQLNSLENPGLEFTHGMADRTADMPFGVGLGYVNGMSGIAGTKSGSAASVIPTILADENGSQQNPESDGASVLMHWMARGLAPENFLTLHYTRDADPADLLTPSRDGTINLDVHTRDASTAASGTNRIVIDSVYPQPTSKTPA
jgi:hypothetical protein